MQDRTKLNATEIGLLHMVDHAMEVQLEREKELEETWPTRPRKEPPQAHYLGSLGCTGPTRPQ